MLRIGRVSWQAVMYTLFCDCVWLFFHILKNNLDAWTSLPKVSSTGKQLLCLSAGHSASEQKVWSWMALRFSFYSGKIPKSTEVQKFWNQGELMKLFGMWFKTLLESDFWCLNRLWINTTMEVFPQNNLRTRILDILLPIFWCLLIWIFTSYHVPWLKVEHCNSQ